MPPVYAIISFFSYRYFRSYTYYELIEVVYEAVTLSAFMLLIIEYVASTASDHSARNALERKDKRKLPIPLCCWRYRPTKAYFLYTMKWLVMQYVVVRPLVSIAAIICQAFNILCENEGLTHFEFAYPYIAIVDFISISLALYGLFVFYGLTKDELEGQRPLAKFLCIKLIVMFTFYQTFVFDALEGRVIHDTPYWTETNIADGLNALAICIEMVFFALAMMWSYPTTTYKQEGVRTGIGRPLWDSINFSDFAAEIWGSLKFFIDYMRGRPGTRTQKMNMAQAFGVEGSDNTPKYDSKSSGIGFAGVGGSAAARNPYNTSDYNVSGQNGAAYTPPQVYGQGSNAYPGHEGNSIDQYGEDVRLTTFTPRNGSSTVVGRFSDETDGSSYPQAPLPYTSPQSRYGPGTGRPPF